MRRAMCTSATVLVITCGGGDRMHLPVGSATGALVDAAANHFQDVRMRPRRKHHHATTEALQQHSTRESGADAVSSISIYIDVARRTNAVVGCDVTNASSPVLLRCKGLLGFDQLVSNQICSATQWAAEHNLTAVHQFISVTRLPAGRRACFCQRCWLQHCGLERWRCEESAPVHQVLALSLAALMDCGSR